MVPRRVFLALFAAASLTSSVASPYTYNSHPHPETSPTLAPLYIPRTTAPQDRLNDSYIVVFHSSVPPTAFESHLTFVAHAHAEHPLLGEDSEDGGGGGGGGGGIAHVYDSVVTKGYAGRFSRDVLEMVRRRPEVKYVEQDQVVRPDAVDVQQNPPWVRPLVS